MGQALLTITKLDPELMLHDFSSMRVHRRRRRQAAILSMVSTQWRSANVTTVGLCESESAQAYAHCDRRSTFDSLRATKKELGHWDTILQTSQLEVVHLTNMSDFISSVWCDAKIPIWRQASTRSQCLPRFGMEACT